jgi:H/ACA ribonucleoprotein complex subunit 4
MGLRLGGGAHMSELRRTKAGLFDISDSNTIAQLEETYSLWKNSSQEAPLKKIVLPVEVALTALPKVWIDDFAVEPLCSGYPLTVPGIIKLHDNIAASEMVAVVTLKDELVALGNALLNSGQMLDMHKGLAVNIHKVFMQPGTYGRRG